MADEKRRVQHFNGLEMMHQERDMRRQELGEAIFKDDHERVAEIDAELIARGEKNIVYEHGRARDDFAQFERDETAREQRKPIFEPRTPDQLAEHDPPLQPEIAAESQPPARSYADLKQEHSGGAVHNPGQEPAEPNRPGERPLRFYEDLNREHDQAREKGEEPQQDGGDKKLNFFEDRNPTQDHGPEH